jgi:hypothetical protein
MGRPKKPKDLRARNAGFTAHPNEIEAIALVAADLGFKTSFDYIRDLIIRDDHPLMRGMIQTPRKSAVARQCHNSVYGAWVNMRHRCYNPKNRAYKHYGGRGIYACHFLRQSADNILSILGEKTGNLSLDRIEVNGSYTCGECAECIEKKAPLNVRWATMSTQAKNRRKIPSETRDPLPSPHTLPQPPA